ncbi:MAG TPA: radical SAM protein [Candidatus Dormibacteraeota bacterium]|nr:radical SAM protein [Candidatus Dormibacteraeota bacterium]
MSSAVQIAATPLMDRLIARTVRKRRPLSVHFDLTYRCNERCVHCYLDHEDHGELTTSECVDALEQLASAGALFLTFSGGEIFLRKDLEELLIAARRLQFDVSLKTNALLITPARAEMLQQHGVRRVQISVYSSDAAIHDAITKVSGSLQRSLAAIPLLKERGIQVKLACPLMKQNLLAYRGVMALAEKLGVPYVLDMTITPMMDGSNAPLEHRVSTEALLPVLQDPTLQPCGTRYVPEEWTSSPILGSSVSSGIESSAYDDLPCSAGHNSCYVSPYGDIYACVQLPMAAGNLRSESFEKIWNNAPALERIRNVRESELPICSRCEIRSYCERCPGLAWMEGGDLLGAYERACSLAEQKAKIAGVVNPRSAWRDESSRKFNAVPISPHAGSALKAERN